mmetsp:Transcript_9290/g.13603  ORF Transcript_9290/g.13603 Transcript_9290/m.13603 type:complete len:160 (+) Transcript_9290:170-649(+)
MNNIAEILGLALPSLKARDQVMRLQPCAEEEPLAPVFDHEDSFLMIKGTFDKGDDETSSTTSFSDMSEMSSASTSYVPVVRFVEDVVTEVRTRPYTKRQDKHLLFYNEYDYLEFRRECIYGQRRTRVVKFADNLVTDVHEIPVVEDRPRFFYTEKELQT